MKKALIVFVIFSFAVVHTAESQGLLNKVKGAVAREISGNAQGPAGKSTTAPVPEPSCACADARLILDLGKFSLNYTEISISIKDDGKLLVRDKISGKFYIVKDGIQDGPYSADNAKVKEFDVEDDSDSDDWTGRFRSYISKSGDKFIIKFNGKSYGPFAQLNDFAVSRSQDKFAAIVIENMLVSEDQGKKMEEAMAKAKSDQERMDIAMKFSQQMSQQMMQGGGTESIQPKLISNVPGAVYDAMTWMGGSLNSTLKYDEITVIAGDKVIDLSGKTLIKLNNDSYSYENMFLNSSNTKYAGYNYGTLTFSDKTKMSDLFSPYLMKKDGKVSLSYMYYSPAKNSIMQCLLPF